MESQMIKKIEQTIEGGIVSLFKKYPQLTPKLVLGGITVAGCVLPLAIQHWPVVVVGVAGYFFVQSVSALPAWLEKLQAAANGVETADPIDVTSSEEK
jgi:hypothetical protein